jgi:hypothetical protein
MVMAHKLEDLELVSVCVRAIADRYGGIVNDDGTPVSEAEVFEDILSHIPDDKPAASWPPMQPMETAPKDGTHILVVTERGFGVAAWLDPHSHIPYWMYCADGNYCTEPYGQCPMSADPSSSGYNDPGTHLIGWWPLPPKTES